MDTPIAEFSENNLYIGQNYKDNVYVHSKFEAEYLIIEACKNTNLVASIYRIGNLSNIYSDGVFQENALENYLKFLKTGGSNYPLEELKVAGVDMTDSKVIERTIKMFDSYIDKFKELYNS